MKLRQPLPNYDWRQESERNRLIEAADEMNHKRNRDIEVGQGRLILTDDSTGARYELSIDYGGLKVSQISDGLDVSVDADIRQAERVILSTYGDTVSVAAKGKNLNKFGTNTTVGNAWETVMQLQSTESEETYVSTNLIDGISSSAAGDTGLVLTIEGHTIDGSGNLTFVIQDATLDGSDARTEVTLSTPLARANRIYVKPSGTFNSPQSEPAGTVYVYDNTGGVTNGVPNNASQTKLILDAGASQSEKCATSISSVDYWFISYFHAGVLEGTPTAGEVTFRMLTRDVPNGGVWRPMGKEIVVNIGAPSTPLVFNPFLIVPKSHDWKVEAQTDSGTAPVYAEAGGYLAAVQ